MQFEQYLKGLKQYKLNELDAKLYNIKASKECNFKVKLKDLADNIAIANNIKRENVNASIYLNPYFSRQNIDTSLIGIISVGITYNNSSNSSSVVEELAKFGVYAKTKLENGSILKDNIICRSDYGRVKIELLPGVDFEDLIVDIDLTEEYMTYPSFVKALLKCNIIENQEQTLNK